jgi:pyruvate dehydrogenase (quinone)
VVVVVVPGDMALQPARDAPPVKVSGMLPPVPVVTPSKHYLERLAAMLNAGPSASQ